MSAFVHRAAIVALLARRAIWMISLARAAPQAQASLALATDELAIVDRLARAECATTTLAQALDRLAAIGEVSAAARRFARPFAIARGLSRVADLQIARRLRAAKYIERS